MTGLDRRHRTEVEQCSVQALRLGSNKRPNPRTSVTIAGWQQLQAFCRGEQVGRWIGSINPLAVNQCSATVCGLSGKASISGGQLRANGFRQSKSTAKIMCTA